MYVAFYFVVLLVNENKTMEKHRNIDCLLHITNQLLWMFFAVYKCVHTHVWVLRDRFGMCTEEFL